MDKPPTTEELDAMMGKLLLDKIAAFNLFGLPMPYWRDRLFMQLDEDDIVHLSQTSTDGRDLMWKLFPSILKQPKYFANTLHLAIKGLFTDVGISTSAAKASTHTSRLFPNKTLRRSVTEKFFINRFDCILTQRFYAQVMGIFGRFVFGEVRMKLCTTKWLQNAERLREIVRAVHCEKAIVIRFRDFRFASTAPHLYILPMELADEILTLPIRCFIRHDLEFGLGNGLDNAHEPFVEQLETKMRELGDKSLYKEVCVYGTFRNKNDLYHEAGCPRLKPKLCVEVGACSHDPTILLISQSIEFTKRCTCPFYSWLYVSK